VMDLIDQIQVRGALERLEENKWLAKDDKETVQTLESGKVV
jgi:hypothetical protein